MPYRSTECTTQLRHPSPSVSLGLILLGLIGAFVFPPEANAASTAQPRIALHLQPVTSRNGCGQPGAAPACGSIVTNGALYPTTYFAYLLVTDGDAADGIAGLALGLNYDGAPHQGVDIYGWASCTTMNFPMLGWPASGTGNVITWDMTSSCQRNEPGGAGTGVVATAGYFYLAAYSPDELEITTHPLGGRAEVVDCQARVSTLEGRGVHHDPSLLGSAVFSAGGTSAGRNPCENAAEPISCLIGGSPVVDQGTTVTYSLDFVPPGAVLYWTRTGNATIIGPTSNALVSVLAGAAGAFEINVRINVSGQESSCSREVTVLPAAPSCEISGLDTVSEGQARLSYSAEIPGRFDSITWSVTGDATIDYGWNIRELTVTAGDPGAFEVTAEVKRTGQPTATCRKTVTVEPFVCGIDGRNPVAPYSSSVRFYAGPELSGASYEWQVSGAATILDGQDRTNPVTLRTDGPGTFILSVRKARGGLARECSRTITVTDDSTPNPSGPNVNTKLLMHLQPVNTRDACGPGSRPSKTEVVTAGGLFPTVYYAYLIAGDADAGTGLSGIQCGIDYDATPHSGVDVFGWTLCAGTEFPRNGPGGAWPAAGSGNTIVWGTGPSCERNEPGGPGTGVVATAGYFYVAAYSPDQLRVTPLPNGGSAVVADCDLRESIIGGAGFPSGSASHLGFANFTASGNAPGFNPYGGGVAVRATTWGAIKALYGAAASPGKP